MKKTSLITLTLALSLAQLSSFAQDRAAIERELAITAYNYAVGCAERLNYSEALQGLSHIPAGRLTAQQQAWADSLRIKCEVMAGHPGPAHEIQLAESELIDIDDQSAAFIHGIQAYQQADYAKARPFFIEAADLGEGPRPQVHIESLFWLGQCEYQLGHWEECCQALIRFNDAKNADTDIQLDAMAYYTMGYARMQQKKWRHARINFERYLDRQPQKGLSTYAEAEGRRQECAALLDHTATSYRQPLSMQFVPADCGQIAAIRESLRKVDAQKSKEQAANAQQVEIWRNWLPPYIR